MFEKKKFVVSNTSDCGDEFNPIEVEAFDLEECVANEYLNSMRELMNVFVENVDGVLEFDKEDFLKHIDDVGFKVENGEGSIWWGGKSLDKSFFKMPATRRGIRGGKVIREVKG